MANKKYKEKNIKARQGKNNLWSFQVRFDYLNSNSELVPYNETFSEKQYGSADIAFKEAVKHKNEMLVKLRGTGSQTIYSKNVTKANKDSMTIKYIFNSIYNYYSFTIATKEKHDVVYRQSISPYENKRIQDITLADIQYTISCRADEYSDDKLQRIGTVWRLIYRTAIILGIIQYDITSAIIIPKSKVIKKQRGKQTDFKTIELIANELLITGKTEKSRFNNKKIYYLLYVMYYTGFRPSEALSLSTDCIDFDKKKIDLNTRIGSTKTEKDVIVTVKTKKSNRSMPIVPELEEILRELVDIEKDRSKYLFLNYDGKFINSTYAGAPIATIKKKLDIEFNLYRMRSLFSRDLFRNNTAPKIIKELLGHESIGQSIDYDFTDNDEKLEVLLHRNLS